MDEARLGESARARLAEARIPAGVWIALAVGLASYGSSAILIRAAGDVQPLAIAAWRTAFVALMLAPLALVRARSELRQMAPHSRALVALSGVLLGLHFCAWIASVQLTTVASAAVLVTTTPLWVGVAGLLGVGHRPSVRTLVAICVGVTGAIVLGSSGVGEGPVPPNSMLGNALALSASVLFAAYTLVGARVRRGTSFLAYFAPVNAVASLTAGVVCLASGASLALSTEALGWCALMAVGPGLVGHGSFALALGYIEATTLSLLTLAEPVLASAFAAAFFGEVPGVVALAGIVLVLASVALAVWKGRARRSGPKSGADRVRSSR